MPSTTDNEYKSLVASYGPGLSIQEMRLKKFGGPTIPAKSVTDLEYTYWGAGTTLSVMDKELSNLQTASGKSGSIADLESILYGTLTNLTNNPAPASIISWSSNNLAMWTVSYAASEITVNRQAGATANQAGSLSSCGLNPINPVLKAGVNYQRSVEVWVDAVGSVGAVGGEGFLAGQALPALTWTRVVQQYVGTGVAGYVTAIRIDIVGVATGVHCKFRKAMLVENPSGKDLAYADGNSPGWVWNGTPNDSSSTGPVTI